MGTGDILSCRRRTSNAEADLAGYNVYRSTVPGNYGAALVPGLVASTHVDGTVGNGTIYYYTVTALNTNGNESARSSEVFAIPAAAGNHPPAFASKPVVETNALEGVAYSATIEDNASDPESDAMIFSKVSGPTWLSVAFDGSLSGTPGSADTGLNSFTVQVDAAGGSDTATLEITVDADTTPAGLAVVFGSNNDGLGGFSTSTPDPTQESWSIESNSVLYINDDPDGAPDIGAEGGTRNGSLLRAVPLDRTAGSSFTFEGVVDFTSGYGDDNNRIGIVLFGDGAGAGLSLEINTDNTKNWIYMVNGIGTTAATGTGLTTGSLLDDALYGTGNPVTFAADVTFTDAVNMDVVFSFTDPSGIVTTHSKTVAQADYAGTYFGFATKARNRGVSSSNRNAPFIMNYKSFRVTDNSVPEPGYDTWAETYGGTNVIGTSTNDYDFDGLDNLYEYGLGGDPTNRLNIGTLPVMEKSGDQFLYVHPQRSDDTNLIYTVETITNLVFGAWTNEGYTVTGTNVTGGPLNFVTNDVDTVREEAFIRLRIGQ